MSTLAKSSEMIKISPLHSASQYTVIGAGPSGMQIMLNLLDQGINPKDILWIDEHFKSGAFDRQLFDIDGNTAMGKYKDIFRKMFSILAKFDIHISENEFALFKSNYPEMFAAAKQQEIALNESQDDIISKYPNIENYCCPLAMVTPLLQSISDKLRSIIRSAPGLVTVIDSSMKSAINLQVVNPSMPTKNFQTRTVIMALGATPKSLKDLAGFDPSLAKAKREISPWLAFSIAGLEKLLVQNNGKIKQIVVVGESHSGALIHKNILVVSDRLEKKGLSRVTAHTLATDTPKFRYTDESGKIINNNNGLDGNSARFIAGMVFDAKIAGKYSAQWKYEILGRRITFADIPDDDGTYIVCAIGFKPPENIKINGQSLGSFIEKHPMGGSFRERIFIGGFTSPVLDEQGIPNVGLTKVFADSQRLAQLAISTERGNSCAFFVFPTPKESAAIKVKESVDSDQSTLPLRAKL